MKNINNVLMVIFITILIILGISMCNLKSNKNVATMSEATRSETYENK